MSIRKVSEDTDSVRVGNIGTKAKYRIDCLFCKVDRKVQKYTPGDKSGTAQ